MRGSSEIETVGSNVEIPNREIVALVYDNVFERVQTPESGWWMMRRENTEPVLSSEPEIMYRLSELNLVE